MVNKRCLRALVFSLLICSSVYALNGPLYEHNMTESQIITELGSWYTDDINDLCALISDGGSMDWNNWDMRDATGLFGKLYDVTSNYTHAEKAAKLLKSFADHMPNWMLYHKYTTTGQTGPFPAGSNAAGLWGKDPTGIFKGANSIFYDLQDYGGKPLGEAYYYIYNSNAMQNLGVLSAIETDVLQRHLDIQYLRGFTNLNYAGAQMGGVLHFEHALDDPNYIAAAMHDCVWNTRAMYKVKFFADGWWCEGTCGYHNMAHGSILNNVVDKFAQGYSDPPGYIDAGDGTRYDNLDLYAELPCIGRASWVRQTAIQPDPDSATYEEHFVIADTWFNTTAWYSSKMLKADSLLYGCMDHAVLGTGEKNGDDINDLTQASLNFGQMNVHEHLDTLTLTLFAKGKEIMSEGEYKPDPNRITDPNADRIWNTSTAGHITVVVDNESQPRRIDSDALTRTKQPEDDVPGIPDWESRWSGQGNNMQEGTLKIFADDFENVQVVEVDAQKAYGTRIDGALMDRYRRIIALVKIDDHDSYVVDIFRVKGGSIHDYMLHSCLEEPYTMQIYDTNDNPQTLSKYWSDPMHTYIHSTYYCTARYDWSVVSTLNDNSAAVKSFVLGINDSANMYVIKGQAQAMRRDGDAEFLLLRHYNFSGEPVSNFIAVHHPYIPAGGPLVTDVEGISLNTTDANAIGVKVTLSSGRIDTIIHTISDSFEQIQTPGGEISLWGHFAHVAQDGSEDSWGYMVDSQQLSISGKQIFADAAYEGTLSGTYRVEANDPCDAFITNTFLPTDGSLNGRYLMVDEGGILVQTFKIDYIEQTGSGSLIHSLDEPGMTITPGLIKQEYYPCWGITSGDATFKICNSKYVDLMSVYNVSSRQRYYTIQAAIDDASSGHTIQVFPGYYYENIDFLGKNLILVSNDPNDPNIVKDTIIEGTGSGSAVIFDGGEGSGCIFSGFMVTGGVVSGILCDNSSPTVSKCNISNNDGDGLKLTNSNSKLSNCLIAGNFESGIEQDGGNVELINCTIIDNNEYGVDYLTAAGSGDKIINSIVRGNAGTSQISSSPLVQYSNVEGGFTGLGNIDTDPCFARTGYWIIAEQMSIDLDATNVEDGLVQKTQPGGDGDTEHVYVSRRDARRTVDPCSDYYMYFDVNDNYAYQGNNQDIYIEIYYYDTEGGLIGLEYDSDDGNDSAAKHKSGGIITIEDEDVWKIHTFHITDAYFGNRQNGGSDFRLAKYNGGRLYLDLVFVRNWLVAPEEMWVAGDCHLMSQAGRWDVNSQQWVIDAVTSHCIDSGCPGSSLDQETIDSNNVRVNMGLYGATSNASKTPADWGLLSDLTNDGRADYSDVDAFSDYWLTTGGSLPADLNKNGKVDFADFALAGQDWLSETSWY